jgi:hypothetical protein
MQDTGKTRERCPDDPLVFGEPFESRCRRLKQGLVREALMRADEGAERLRDRKSEEAGRPRELFVEVVLKPLLRCMLRALGAVAVAPSMMDAVVSRTVGALREAMAIGAAAAVLDGADHLTVCGGEVRIALQVFGRKGGEDVPQGGHGSRPCMRVLRRS